MSEIKQYAKPRPIINKKEEQSLITLTEKYKKMTTPGKLAKAGKKVSEKALAIIPDSVKRTGNIVKAEITEAELFLQCMKVVGEGFGILEKQAAKASISEKSIVNKINATTKNNEITSLDEVCLARGYRISELVSKYKTKDLLLALGEGSATGAFGFAGLPFNLVLSTFIFYRAVQSIALFYGYDVKHDASELVIASDVFMNALSPGSRGTNEIGGIIGKVMVMTEVTAVKQTAKKHGKKWLPGEE